MRYYNLSETGKVRGSYAIPQPDKVLHLLEDAPDNESKRDGVPGESWIPDQELIDARLAGESFTATKEQILADNLPSWAAVETAVNNISNLAEAKSYLLKLSRVVYLDVKNSAD